MLTEEDKNAAMDYAEAQSSYDKSPWANAEDGFLAGIEHERKRWYRYHPEPGFNYMLPTPSNPFNIIEQVGEKHWRIKEGVPGKRWRLSEDGKYSLKDGHE